MQPEANLDHVVELLRELPRNNPTYYGAVHIMLLPIQVIYKALDLVARGN